MKKFILLLVTITSFTVFAAAQTAYGPQAGTSVFRQEGLASWYGTEFDGRPTASGELFNSNLFTAAHPTLPFGTVVLVTNRQNMRSVTVRINDRGPFVPSRIIDLSRAAAEALDMINTGTAQVIVEQVHGTSPGPAAAFTPAAPPPPAPVTVFVPQPAQTAPFTVYTPPPAQPAPAPFISAPPPAQPAPVTVFTPAAPPPAPAPFVAAPPPAPVAVVPPPAPAPVMVYTPPTAPVVTGQETQSQINSISANLIEPIPVTVHTPQAVQTPPPAAQTAQPAGAFFDAPPARLRGADPEAGSAKLYRLQVGSFSVPRNAVDAFDMLRNAGLSPAYERNNEFYRLVLANIRADDIPSIAQTLGNLGFREAIVREEN